MSIFRNTLSEAKSKLSTDTTRNKIKRILDEHIEKVRKEFRMEKKLQETTLEYFRHLEEAKKKLEQPKSVIENEHIAKHLDDAKNLVPVIEEELRKIDKNHHFLR